MNSWVENEERVEMAQPDLVESIGALSARAQRYGSRAA